MKKVLYNREEMSIIYINSQQFVSREVIELWSEKSG